MGQRKGFRHSEKTKKKIKKNNAKYWTGKKRPDISRKFEGEGNPMYGKIPWNKGIPHSKTTVVKISRSIVRKWDDARYRDKQLGRTVPLKTRRKIKISVEKCLKENPKIIERMTKHGNHGIISYSDDGVFHPSRAQRDCYDWIRKDLKLKIRKFGRFDFIIEGRIILEYHPCNWFLEKRTKKQYYNDREKLLDELGHKDLKLIVMVSLSDEEKTGVKKLLGRRR